MVEPAPQKILIIRLSSLGDIVLSYPLLSALHKHFPHAEIDFLVRPEYQELVRYHPAVHQVLLLNPEKGLFYLWKLRKQLFQKNYDVILDIHRNLRTFVLLAGTRFKQIIFRLVGKSANPRVYRVKKQQLARFLLVRFKINWYRRLYGGAFPVWEKYLRTAAPLGISSAETTRNFYYPENARQKALQILKNAGISTPFVVMAPGSRHFTKRWPAEYFAELAELIFQRYRRPTVLVGGSQEKQVAREVIKHARSVPITSVVGQLSILETAAVIHRASLMVTNDSGLMHIADALNVPLVAIFGSTVREFGFFPSGKHARVVEHPGLSCRPCSHIGLEKCPKGHFRCMREVTPGQVLETITNLLAEAEK